MDENRQITEHEHSVRMLTQEIQDGCSKTEIIEDILRRSTNLTIKFRRQPMNNFCFAVLDLTSEGNPKQTWLFDLGDFPTIFKRFKERGIVETVWHDVVLLALDTLRKIKDDIQGEKTILDIIHEAEDARRDEGANGRAVQGS